MILVLECDIIGFENDIPRLWVGTVKFIRLFMFAYWNSNTVDKRIGSDLASGETKRVVFLNKFSRNRNL